MAASTYRVRDSVLPPPSFKPRSPNDQEQCEEGVWLKKKPLLHRLPPRFGLGETSQVDSIPSSPSPLTLHFHQLQFVRRFLRVSVLHSAAPSSLCKQSSHGRIGYRGVAQSWSPACHYRASTRVLKIELFRFPVQWNCRSRLLIDRNPLRLCQPLPIGTRLSPNWDFGSLNRRDT